MDTKAEKSDNYDVVLLYTTESDFRVWNGDMSDGINKLYMKCVDYLCYLEFCCSLVGDFCLCSYESTLFSHFLYFHIWEL